MNSLRQSRKMKSNTVITTGRIERPKKKMRVSPPLHSITSLAESGIKAFDAGNYHKAAHCFSQALFKTETNVLRNKLESSPTKSGDDDESSSLRSCWTQEYDEGMKVYTSAIPLHDDYQSSLLPAALCYNIAQTCLKREKPATSRKWFNSALQKLEQYEGAESIVQNVKILNDLGYGHKRVVEDAADM